MRKLTLVLILFFTVKIATAQRDSTKLLVGFPITNYMVDLNDSVILVQVVPGGLWDIEDKQLGLVRGIYRNGKLDSITKGVGKCHLIKADYYYFAINIKQDSPGLKAGDLLYTFIPMSGKYIGKLTRLAAHYISLQSVTDENFFNRGDVFLDFDSQKENALLDSMVSDIHFTGKYYTDNDKSMNRRISGGKFNNKMMLETMISIERKDLLDFFDYMLARSFMYSGNNWKLSEIFATWLVAGAPDVSRN